MKRLVRDDPTHHVSDIISNILHIYVCNDVRKEYVNFTSNTILTAQDDDMSDD